MRKSLNDALKAHVMQGMSPQQFIALLNDNLSILDESMKESEGVLKLQVFYAEEVAISQMKAHLKKAAQEQGP